MSRNKYTEEFRVEAIKKHKIMDESQAPPLQYKIRVT
jgi:hypothetical protein